MLLDFPRFNKDFDVVAKLEQEKSRGVSTLTHEFKVVDIEKKETEDILNEDMDLFWCSLRMTTLERSAKPV